MKILVFNGSPKGEKSDVMHLTRAFLQGMDEVRKNQTTIIHVTEKKIGYCKGCLTCMKNGGECVQKDDMKEILSEILQSDILLFSFPLYCYGMPAPLKALLDRTIPLSSMAMVRTEDRYEHVAQADFSKLKYVMICGCGFPNAKHNFEGMVKQFELSFPENHTIITVPESPMFNAPEAAIVTEPFLELVKTAGREYASDGKISLETMEKLAVPMIPEEVYVKIVNGEN